MATKWEMYRYSTASLLECVTYNQYILRFSHRFYQEKRIYENGKGTHCTMFNQSQLDNFLQFPLVAELNENPSLL